MAVLDVLGSLAGLVKPFFGCWEFQGDGVGAGIVFGTDVFFRTIKAIFKSPARFLTPLIPQVKSMLNQITRFFVLAACVLGTLFLPKTSRSDDDATSKDAKASELFENRIMPIFRSEKPSSCVQCHLSSVDLKNYILPSSEKTFVSLRDQGLIDLANPKSSKILTLIDMGEKDRDDLSRRIHEEMRQAEYAAFASWIEACVKDKRLRELPPLESTELARPLKPDEVIRHARKSRVVNSFVRNIWSQRLRCFPCHTPNDIQPKQKKARDGYEQWVDQYGDQMDIFKKTPIATIRSLIEKSKNTREGDLPLINLDDPYKSLLLLKPTSKIPPKVDGEIGAPTYSAPVYHMGGLKMHVDDQSYKSFSAWIQDYANVVGDKYDAVEDLPADNWFATKRVIRLKNAPETWEVGTTVQFFVFSHNDQSKSWSEKPIAFTQGTVTKRKIVNGALFMLAPEDDEEFVRWKKTKNKLPRGRYLVKVYVDQNGKIAKDPTILLGDRDLAGQIEIQQAKWQIGFPKAELVSGSDLNTD